MTAPPPPHAAPADSSPQAQRVLNALLSWLPARRRERIHDYLVLTRLDRPVGALLLLWPTWWALWLAADGTPPFGTWVIFSLGVFTMRAAGCAINDFADRKLDAQIARTQGRPLAAGRLQPREALYTFFILLLVSFGLVLLCNRATILLSFGGAVLAALYPFCKRFTHLPQVVLGATFGWSIPMAYCAVLSHVPAQGWWLFLGNILWSVIYDTEYALTDRQDDLKAGNKSTAILFGSAVQPILGGLMLLLLWLLYDLGQQAWLTWPYWLALLAAALSFLNQQRLLAKDAEGLGLSAFRANNRLGMILWLGLALGTSHY